MFSWARCASMEINGVIVAAEIRALSAICGSFRDATRPFRLLLLLPCPRASTSPWDGLIGGLHPRRARPIACSRARAAGVRAEVCATYCTSARSCSRQDIKHPSKGDVERKIDFENTPSGNFFIIFLPNKCIFKLLEFFNYHTFINLLRLMLFLFTLIL